jgi:hypothetical protein
MIRTIGLALSALAIITATVVACDKGKDNKPELTTVIKKPDGSCMGYDTCPTKDDQHITAFLEPSTVTTNVEVPTTSLSPTSTEVPTVTPSATSTMVPTVSTTP